MKAESVHRSSTFAATLVNALLRYPQRIALADPQGELTYHDIYCRISQLTQVFESLGLEPGDGISQLSPNCVDAALLQLAAWACGLRYVPLHPMGSPEDHRFILDDSEISALVLHPSNATASTRLLREAPSIKVVLSHGPCEGATDLISLTRSFACTSVVPADDPDAVAAVLYTGGTTGRPKGVTLTSAQMVMNVLLTLSGWEWPSSIRFLCSTPITHATGCMLVPILDRGGSIHLQSAFDADDFLDTVQSQHITATFLVPTMIYRLTDAQRKHPRDVSSLETVIYGAAPTTVARLREALELFGPIFSQIYSQSEAPCCAVVLRRNEHLMDDIRLTSCGRPMAGITVDILNDDGEPVRDGDVGEICLRGPSIMRGYWRRDRETSEVLRHGWLHTGDLAYRDAEGFLYIVDRKKEMIISGGFNIYPREIEDVLSTHEAVSQVAIIAVPDDHWGEAVKAIVVRRQGHSAEEAELIAWVKARKGSLGAPKSVDFVDELPLTALGKPDKKAMRSKYWFDKERQVN